MRRFGWLALAWSCALVLLQSGCKTGAWSAPSWMTPSAWSKGASSKDDALQISRAPTRQKPSQQASPVANSGLAANSAKAPNSTKPAAAAKTTASTKPPSRSATAPAVATGTSPYAAPGSSASGYGTDASPAVAAAPRRGAPSPNNGPYSVEEASATQPEYPLTPQAYETPHQAQPAAFESSSTPAKSGFQVGPYGMTSEAEGATTNPAPQGYAPPGSRYGEGAADNVPAEANATAASRQPSAAESAYENAPSSSNQAPSGDAAGSVYGSAASEETSPAPPNAAADSEMAGATEEETGRVAHASNTDPVADDPATSAQTNHAVGSRSGPAPRKMNPAPTSSPESLGTTSSSLPAALLPVGGGYRPGSTAVPGTQFGTATRPTNQGVRRF